MKATVSYTHLAEIQSAPPVRIGISVSLVPDYLPGLETQLDKFRQQYPLSLIPI